MTQPLTQKPDNSDPKELVFANLGGLPKIVQRIIDRNQNNIPDVLENIDVKKLKVNGKSFTSWNEVVAEFKNIQKSSTKTQPLDISFGGTKIETKKKPATITIGKSTKTLKDPMQIQHEAGQKPLKVGGGFTVIKILLALGAIGVVIYYIIKYAS